MTLFELVVSALHVIAEIISRLVYVCVWVLSADSSEAHFQTVSPRALLLNYLLKRCSSYPLKEYYWSGSSSKSHQRLQSYVDAPHTVYVLFVLVAAVQQFSPQGSLKFHRVLMFFQSSKTTKSRK